MWKHEDYQQLIPAGIIGMVHLRALPGAPAWTGDWPSVLDAARRDATALREGGAGAIMLENFGDVPFCPDRVDPVTVAAMTRAALAVRDAAPDLPLGINVLRNDAGAALAVAAAVQAAFIRVNVHSGSAVTDQGLLSGEAWRTLRLRRELGLTTGILADVRVKHARPLVERPLADEVKDLRLRGLADGIIVTGEATGSAADLARVAAVRDAVPDCPVLVGSGLEAGTAAAAAGIADGAIVGTALKEKGTGSAGPVSAARTADIVAAWQEGRRQGKEKS